MGMMSFFEIKLNPNITDFFIKQNSMTEWNVFFKIDGELHQVKTQRKQVRNFKTVDSAVRFVASCGKTNKVTVLFD